MAMTTTRMNDLTKDAELELRDLHIAFLAVGAGSVDPDLIAPRDGEEEQQVEELIAFRCSCL
jgi:hypothetical protein